MFQFFLQLGGALGAEAAIAYPFRVLVNLTAACRANDRRGIGFSTLGPRLKNDSDNLGDYFARFLHLDHIADAQVLAFYFLKIVKRCAFYHCTGQLHRLEFGNRRYRAGFSYLKADVQQARTGRLSGEFVGDHPARRLGRGAQSPTLFETVHLDYHAVRLIVEIMALLSPFFAHIEHFINVHAMFGMGIYG